MVLAERRLRLQRRILFVNTSSGDELHFWQSCISEYIGKNNSKSSVELSSRQIDYDGRYASCVLLRKWVKAKLDIFKFYDRRFWSVAIA